MLLKEALEEYLFDCEGRGLSEETVRNYGFNLKCFCSFLFEKNIEHIEQINVKHLKQYTISLQKKKQEESYINTQLVVVKGFLNYLHKEEYVEEKIEVNKIKKKHKIIETFSDEEIEKLLKACDTKSFIGMRDTAILHMMIDTGLRAGEIIRLENSHVKENNTLFVQGKGKKERWVPFSPVLRKVLMKYERMKKSYFLDKPYLPNHYFLSRYGQPITRFILQYMVLNIGNVAMIEKDKLFPHNFRHYYAVKNLREGLDVYSLSRLMGHSDISITSVYMSSIKDEQIQELSLKSSPLMNLNSSKK